MDLGVDSLMAVELRNVLGAGLALQQTLPATLIFDYPSVQAIASYLARDVLAFDVALAAPTGTTHAPDAPVATGTDGKIDAAALEHLSDEEVAALMMKRLDQMK